MGVRGVGRRTEITTVNQRKGNLMKANTVLASAVAAGLALAAGAQAQGLVTSQKISAQLANELVGMSVANCAAKNYLVTAVVVDLDGVRQAFLRGDGAPMHTLDNAYFKAYPVAALGLARKEDSTKAIADRMAKAPPSNLPS